MLPANPNPEFILIKTMVIMMHFNRTPLDFYYLNDGNQQATPDLRFN